MKNNIDFVYEYSDLNLFQTRVKVLTGKYADVVLEFGGSLLTQYEMNNDFSFQYTFYELPKGITLNNINEDPNILQFLSDLLVAVIDARYSDPEEHNKLMEAASFKGKTYSDISIDNKWYPKHLEKKQQPNTTLGDF
jgi:hypothetical protein